MESRKKLTGYFIVYLSCTSTGCLPCVNCEQCEGERTSLLSNRNRLYDHPLNAQDSSSFSDYPSLNDHSGDLRRSPISGIPYFSISKLSSNEANEELGFHGRSDTESEEDINLCEANTPLIRQNMIGFKNSGRVVPSSKGIIESSTSSDDFPPQKFNIKPSTRRTNKNVPLSSICKMNASSNLAALPVQVEITGLNQAETPASVGSMNSNSIFIEHKNVKKKKKEKTHKAKKTLTTK